MEVRRATIEDAEALGRGMKVVADEGQWIATEADASAQELVSRYRVTIRSEEIVFVLEEEGEVVGSLALTRTAAKGVLGLGMWVLPEWRGRGGGRLLMEAALAARPVGAHKIELEVFPENEAAVRLYRAMGFEEEGLRRSHYRRRDGSLRSALLMSRLFT